jgi:hypothetical protein
MDANQRPRKAAEVHKLLRADDGDRTRDLDVGNVALYQLSYVRVRRGVYKARSCAP